MHIGFFLLMPCNLRVTKKAAQQKFHYSGTYHYRNTLKLKVSFVLREPLLHSCQDDRLLHLPAKATPSQQAAARRTQLLKAFLYELHQPEKYSPFLSGSEYQCRLLHPTARQTLARGYLPPHHCSHVTLMKHFHPLD